jgi:ribose 5-phosphate isomerase B
MVKGTEMRIAIGADHAGADLKNLLRDRLAQRDDVAVTDLGVPDAVTTTAYPHIGSDVAQAVARGEADRGLLVCGTGIGMAITANKVPGIRATVAHDAYSVGKSVTSNNCQVLALGARVIGPELAWTLVEEWLRHTFDDTSSSASRVALIDALEATGSCS